jgi:nicotinate phosphoribosyltransferase
MTKHILDTDLYKISMCWLIIKHFPNIKVKYEFVNRGKTQFPIGFDEKLLEKLKVFVENNNTYNFSDEFHNTDNFLNKLKTKCYFIPNIFWDFLKGFRLNLNEIKINQVENDLNISVEGYWYSTIFWEIILMSSISELYFQMTDQKILSFEELQLNDKNKFEKLSQYNINFSEFGTRRRYSYDNQIRVLNNAIKYSKKNLIGTSNVLLAIKNNITPIGTFAHEYVSGVGVLYGYEYANRHMMKIWNDVYDGKLGIALTDTFGVDLFLKDFNYKYATLFTGVRHDSGSGFIFTDRIVSHYKSLGIDPLTKTIIFSDGLDVNSCIELNEYCKNKIKCSFGIGTSLTNDVGVKPLNIVIKLFEVNGNPAIKLSDVAGKHTGDKKTIDLVKELINYKGL